MSGWLQKGGTSGRSAGLARFGVLLLVVAVLAVTGAVHGAVTPNARAASCRSIHLWLLAYQYSEDPTPYLDSCWTGGGSTVLRPRDNSGYVLCNPNGVSTHASTGTVGIYDDTSFNHTSPSDATNVYDCYWGLNGYTYPPNWTSQYLAGEYMYPKSDTCTTGCWYKMTSADSGFGVSYYFADLYYSNSHVENLYNVWLNGDESGINPTTTAGNINLSPYGGPYVTDGQGTGIENYVTGLCADTPDGNRLGIYSSNPIADSNASSLNDTSGGEHMIEYYIYKAMNMCT